MATHNRWQPWTETEWAVIKAAVDRDPLPKYYAADLLPLLPGRTVQDIRNSVNRERKLRKGLCNCGGLLTDDRATCLGCAKKQRTYREQRIVDGLCVKCGDSMGDDGTATICVSCMKAHRARYSKKDAAKVSKFWRTHHPKKVQKKEAFNIPLWLAGRTVPFFLANTPKGYHIVDLFGGSGDLTIRAAKAGHEVLAYNDIHPMLVAYMRVLQAGKAEALLNRTMWEFNRWARPQKGAGAPDHDTFRLGTETVKQRYVEAMQRARSELVAEPEYRVLPLDLDEEEELNRAVYRASHLLLVSRNVSNKDMLKKALPEDGLSPLPREVCQKIRAIPQWLVEAEPEITCLDFAEAIPYHDCERSVFLCDPPWPGATSYEHSIEGRHRELVELLLGIRGRFILTMQSSRVTLDAMRDVPHLYWLSNALAKLVVGSNFPLVERAGLVPINRQLYGAGGRIAA